jgi:hypothetical protein
MNFRLFFGALVILGYSSLNAVTVKVQDWYLQDEDDQVLVDATELCDITKKIQEQIKDGGYELGNDGVDTWLYENQLAAMIAQDGNFFFLNKESYDQVMVNNVMVPGETEMESRAITTYQLSSIDLEYMISDALGALQWQQHLGQLVTAMLNPDGGSNPGDASMNIDDFIGLWIGLNN